jgi:plastocyanin
MYQINRRNVLFGSVATCAATGAGVAGVKATAGTPSTHKVMIKNFRFDPPEITVHIGDTIIWINKDIAPHTATADAGGWDTGTLEKGQSENIKVVAETAGAYFCIFHPQMKGRITIG